MNEKGHPLKLKGPRFMITKASNRDPLVSLGIHYQ